MVYFDPESCQFHLPILHWLIDWLIFILFVWRDVPCGGNHTNRGCGGDCFPISRKHLLEFQRADAMIHIVILIWFLSWLTRLIPKIKAFWMNPLFRCVWPPTLTLLHLLIARRCFKIIMNTNTETSPHAYKMRLTQQCTERGLSHQSCWATKSRWWVRMFFCCRFFQHFIQNHKAMVWDLGFKAKVILFKRVLMISSWVTLTLLARCR